MKVHNYCDHRHYGHDIAVTHVDGLQIRGMGWGNVRKNEYILVKGDGDLPILYRLKEVKYSLDPKDMFSFVATFEPGRMKIISGSKHDYRFDIDYEAGQG